MPDLETVDLADVEIMRVGGPVKGIGSPPGGDHFTEQDLSQLAENAKALDGEIAPSAHIGHDPKFGDPALGDLTNIRLSADGKRLVTDIRNVPRRFADLIKARAYKHRSVEMHKVTSQRDGKDRVAITGMGWGGGRLPAIHGMADVAVLYEGDATVADRFLLLEENEQPLDTDKLFEALYAWAGQGGRGDDRGAADTRPAMGETKFTDEQRHKFSEATDRKLEDVTDELLAKAGVAPETPEEPKPDEAKPDPDATRALEQKIEASDQRVRALEQQLAAERKTNFVTAVLKDGKAEPGQREKIERLYEKDPEGTVALFDTISPNTEWAREYGSAEEGDPAAAQEAEQEKIYARHFEETFGTKPLHVRVEEKAA